MRSLVPFEKLLLSSLILGGCAAHVGNDEAYSEGNGTDDVSVGTIEEGVDGWGYALDCKPIPPVEPLVDPEVIVSLNGLTLHLRDRAGDYDRVFPIGAGAIKNSQSLTPDSEDTPKGYFTTGSNTDEVEDGEWGYYYPCRIWSTDSDTGKDTPVFAGLPFIRLAGPPTAGYGIHGPIDNFGKLDGGTLRHGYVSHGCIRMAAADIVEVYGRVHQHPKTPVRVQQDAEVTDELAVVDVESRWIGSACSVDAECNYAGGYCRIPSGPARGTCTRSCTKSCPDRAGEAPTFCVDDPGNDGGICVPKASKIFNHTCHRYEDRLALAEGVPRPDQSATANVCLPPAN